LENGNLVKIVIVICVTAGGISLVLVGRPDLGANCFIGILTYFIGEWNGRRIARRT